ncbi:flavin-containing monooxygenase [Nocardia transvalensis]|uniref:flavin-containing monooxygenase n=1 Tax=Nocardia transvalensis TaxID=37333 RepID=UPI00189354FF|nr:NAD(P)/FAD-dependent oxidoreductase [Nocardia transvalensis]MBF6331839.1 NAD(P)/FAD-dependent oxidoreductase [Nocardia transvalensis]
MTPSIESDGIDQVSADMGALRQKYRVERDKRLRSDGSRQYVRLENQLANSLDDPYTPVAARPPQTDHTTVVCIGGGFAGLVTGARLREAGVNGVRIIEQGGDFGGTWYWNRYPGAQADTHSLVYLPLLEETGYVPTEKYAHGPEILEHCRRIGKHYDLYADALFHTTVTKVTWDDVGSRWVIQTDRGDRVTAQFVVMGIGPLNVPKLPGVPGIDRFRGHSFHTSRWDYSYTGGSPAGDPMDRLGDKRVAIIGTGATAVQCVPHLAEACRELYVFQRTPSSVDVRNNEPIDPQWFHQMATSGWQQRWMENFAANYSGRSVAEDLVMDGWTAPAKRIQAVISQLPAAARTPETLAKVREKADFEKMSQIRARVDAVVKDHDTAQQLKAWYSQMCKRPCFHDEYLKSYNRPSTHLVDTDGKGIEGITEAGVMACGREWVVDCIIYASGFEVATPFTFRAGYEVTGRGGLTLSDHWAEGMRTFHGSQVRHFPNAFVVQPFQGANFLTNIPHDIAESAKTITSIVRRTLDGGHREVEPSQAAEQAWIDLVLSGAGSFQSSLECTPGLYNNEGNPDEPSHQLNSGYPDGPLAYYEYIQRWRALGTFDELEFR